MKLPSLLLLAPLLLAGCMDALAQDAPKVNVLIDIGRPGERAIPIAIPLPKGSADQEFWNVVRRDLELSGWFRVLDANASLEPAGAGIRPGEFDFADWRPTGAAVLAKTNLADVEGKLRSEVWVYGVAAGEKLGAKAFSAPASASRSLAHRVADHIIQTVTGERSFFDTKFAFVGNFSGNKEIYLVDADGHGRRQITKNGSINLKPKWNATGSAIVYTSYAAGNPDLYVADLGKGQIRRVSARSGINTGGAFSPLGDILALTLSISGDSEIFTIDPYAGKEIARLTASPGIDVSPTWSPDGSKVAFVSERSGGPQIYVMNADGSGAKRVTFSGSQNTDPSWSPTGDRIAFVGRDSGRFDVFTVRTDGSGMTRITQGDGDNEDPSWSPDGQYLAFSSNRDGGTHIWIASADGRFQTKVTTGGGRYTNPHWSNHLSW
ncbi:MAG: Tol-Pal system beta propeller repeat protein TolB [Myxococcota bacterium]